MEFVGSELNKINNKLGPLCSTFSNMQINSGIQQQYIDSVLESLHDQMIENGLDNIALPDTKTNFSKRRLGVTWQGEAELYNGNLKGLESIHRTGEAAIKLNIDGVTVDVEVGINNPLVNYDIHATFMKHGPRGTIAGSLTHITCDVQLNFILGTETVTLEKLVVKDIGGLKARVTGLGSVLNFIVSHILQVVGNRVKWKVSQMLEGVIKDLLNDIIAKTPLPSPAINVKSILP